MNRRRKPPGPSGLTICIASAYAAAIVFSAALGAEEAALAFIASALALWIGRILFL